MIHLIYYLFSTTMKKTITLAIASALLLSGLSVFGKEKGSSSALDLFDGPLLDAKGTEVSKEALAGKTIGIYFSASWCQPCKKFTPQLVEAYHAAMADGHKDELDVLFEAAPLAVRLAPPRRRAPRSASTARATTSGRSSAARCTTSRRTSTFTPADERS